MSRRPRRRRGESPPRSSRRSWRSVSRSPGTSRSWRTGSPSGAARIACPGHAPAASSGSAASPCSRSALNAMSPASVPDARPSRRSGTPSGRAPGREGREADQTSRHVHDGHGPVRRAASRASGPLAGGPSCAGRAFEARLLGQGVGNACEDPEGRQCHARAEKLHHELPAARPASAGGRIGPRQLDKKSGTHPV